MNYSAEDRRLARVLMTSLMAENFAPVSRITLPGEESPVLIVIFWAVAALGIAVVLI